MTNKKAWMIVRAHFVSLGLICTILTGPTLAQDSQDLAKQLSNPIASLIQVPIKLNFDQRFGPGDSGEKLAAVVQPVVPFSLNEDWNVVSRTIVPIVYQDDIFPGAGDQFGLGDIVESLFFSPSQPGPSGIIWGAGPVFLFPTGTDPLLSGEKWGAGPTAVVLKQIGPVTVGGLANHIWSFAGDSSRADVNATFLQPFVSYTTPNAVTFGLNTETTYNWETEAWSVPINATVSKLTRFGGQPVSLSAGARYWAESPTAGPEGLGFTLGMTFLYPKGAP